MIFQVIQYFFLLPHSAWNLDIDSALRPAFQGGAPCLALEPVKMNVAASVGISCPVFFSQESSTSSTAFQASIGFCSYYPPVIKDGNGKIYGTRLQMNSNDH